MDPVNPSFGSPESAPFPSSSPSAFSPSAPFDGRISGYLRRQKKKGFQEKWVTLNGCVVEVYKSHRKSEAEESYSLVDCLAVAAPPSLLDAADLASSSSGATVAPNVRWFGVSLAHARNIDQIVVTFATTDEEEFKAWHRAFNAVSEALHTLTDSERSYRPTVLSTTLRTRFFSQSAPIYSFKKYQSVDDRPIHILVPDTIVPNDGIHRPSNHFVLRITKSIVDAIHVTPDTQAVYRDQQDFEFLRKRLVNYLPSVIIPPLPIQSVSNSLFSLIFGRSKNTSSNAETKAYRCKQICMFLAQCVIRPAIVQHELFTFFLSPDRRRWNQIVEAETSKMKREPKIRLEKRPPMRIEFVASQQPNDARMSMTIPAMQNSVPSALETQNSFVPSPSPVAAANPSVATPVASAAHPAPSGPATTPSDDQSPAHADDSKTVADSESSPIETESAVTSSPLDATETAGGESSSAATTIAHPLPPPSPARNSSTTAAVVIPDLVSMSENSSDMADQLQAQVHNMSVSGSIAATMPAGASTIAVNNGPAVEVPPWMITMQDFITLSQDGVRQWESCAEKLLATIRRLSDVHDRMHGTVGLQSIAPQFVQLGILHDQMLKFADQNRQSQHLMATYATQMCEQVLCTLNSYSHALSSVIGEEVLARMYGMLHDYNDLWIHVGQLKNKFMTSVGREYRLEANNNISEKQLAMYEEIRKQEERFVQMGPNIVRTFRALKEDFEEWFYPTYAYDMQTAVQCMQSVAADHCFRLAICWGQ